MGLFGGAGDGWKPTRILDVAADAPVQTSTRPLLVETDQGRAYVKAVDNPEGPSALVCEWVGTSLARWLGLPTLSFCILDFPSALRAPGAGAGGPVFATRLEEGSSWLGDPTDLELVVNPDAMSGLVVFDTWTRNADRFTPRLPKPNVKNVFLARADVPGRHKMLAMDHTECFRSLKGELKATQLDIGCQQEDALYGHFPEFMAYLSRERWAPFVERLRAFGPPVVAPILDEVPAGWALTRALREKLSDFCWLRARHVAANIESWLERVGC